MLIFSIFLESKMQITLIIESWKINILISRQKKYWEQTDNG
jgi:hypothetical protein